MILFFKIATLVATCVFAVFGMKAEHGGIKALLKHLPFWAVVSTTLLSGGLLFFETNKAAQDSLEASRQIQKSAQQLDENLKTTKGVAEGMQKSLGVLQGLESGNKTISSNLGQNLETSGTILNKQTMALSQQNELLAQQNNLLKRQETTIANITGGDSFCYVYSGFVGNVAVLFLRLQGKYPVRGVTIDIHDRDEPATGNFRPGPMRYTLDAIPNLLMQFSLLDLKEQTEKRFSIDITSVYLKLGENLFLAKVGDKWKVAYNVYERQTIIIAGKMPPVKILRQCIDKDFPSSIQLPFSGNIRCTPSD